VKQVPRVALCDPGHRGKVYGKHLYLLSKNKKTTGVSKNDCERLKRNFNYCVKQNRDATNVSDFKREMGIALDHYYNDHNGCPEKAWCKYRRETAKQEEQRQKREERNKEKRNKESETLAKRTATDTSDNDSDNDIANERKSRKRESTESRKRESTEGFSTDDDGTTDSDKTQMDEVDAILEESKTDDVDPMYKMKCSGRWMDKSHKSYEHVKHVHDTYTQESYLKMMMHQFDTQANEAMNKRITKSCPKHLHLSKTNSLKSRISLSVSVASHGYKRIINRILTKVSRCHKHPLDPIERRWAQLADNLDDYKRDLAVEPRVKRLRVKKKYEAVEEMRIKEHEGKKNGMDYNGGIATKPAKQKPKPKPKNKQTSEKRICLHCSRDDHQRLTSRLCPLNAKYDFVDKDDEEWVTARAAIAAKATVAAAAK
jgi:hypothetical protein